MARDRFRRSSKREIESVRWSGATSSFLAFGAGTNALTFLSASNDPPETLMRIRGELVAWIDAVQAPASMVDIAIGVIKVPEGTGTGGTMSPITDDEAPWMMYERFTLGYEEYVTDVIDAPGLTVFRKSIDVKSMRIIRPGVELQLAVENVTLNGVASVNISFAHRGLLGAT